MIDQSFAKSSMKFDVKKKIVPVPSLILSGEKRKKKNKGGKQKVLFNMPNILQSKTVGEERTEFRL